MLGGNKIPESYLAKFLPKAKDNQDMPADIAAFIRSITKKEQNHD